MTDLGVRLRTWEDRNGYDVYDDRTGRRIGGVSKRGGGFHARHRDRELARRATLYDAVADLAFIA